MGADVSDPAAAPAPNLPPTLDFDDVVTVEANEKGLGAYTRHYGVRIKHDHPGGSWRRDGEVWVSPGMNTKELWPDMSGPPTVQLGSGDIRTLMYAIGAADGCQKVVNRLTPANRRDQKLDAHASVVVEPTKIRFVIMSGREYTRGREHPAGIDFEHERIFEPTENGPHEPVALGARYLLDIATRIGHAGVEIDLWISNKTDVVGIRGAYGEAILMPERL
jgi:hypothetical protein